MTNEHIKINDTTWVSIDNIAGFREYTGLIPNIGNESRVFLLYFHRPVGGYTEYPVEGAYATAVFEKLTNVWEIG